MKYVGINLTKQLKVFYIENYKMLVKLKKTQISGKHFVSMDWKKINIL